jgi:hypothetical protein
MRKCKYRDKEYTFLQFGMGSSSNGLTTYQHPVAILEDENGKIKIVNNIEFIQFIK